LSSEGIKTKRKIFSAHGLIDYRCQELYQNYSKSFEVDRSSVDMATHNLANATLQDYRRLISWYWRRATWAIAVRYIKISYIENILRWQVIDKENITGSIGGS